MLTKLKCYSLPAQFNRQNHLSNCLLHCTVKYYMMKSFAIYILHFREGVLERFLWVAISHVEDGFLLVFKLYIYHLMGIARDYSICGRWSVMSAPYWYSAGLLFCLSWSPVAIPVPIGCWC